MYIISSSEMLERLSQTFSLQIKNNDNNQTYNLNFQGSKTIQEVSDSWYIIFMW